MIWLRGKTGLRWVFWGEELVIKATDDDLQPDLFYLDPRLLLLPFSTFSYHIISLSSLRKACQRHHGESSKAVLAALIALATRHDRAPVLARSNLPSALRQPPAFLVPSTSTRGDVRKSTVSFYDGPWSRPETDTSVSMRSHRTTSFLSARPASLIDPGKTRRDG